MEIQLQQFSPELQTLLITLQQTSESLTIVNNGQPLAILAPLPPKKRANFGCMRDTATISDDIVAPAIAPTEWEALQ